eukprot:5125796-Pleurochrysis_carterae.AAC.2
MRSALLCLPFGAARRDRQHPTRVNVRGGRARAGHPFQVNATKLAQRAALSSRVMHSTMQTIRA